MAYIILDDCISCGACESECPNQAITAGDDKYIIDPDLCTECVGFHEDPQCAEVCPVDVCVPDPARTETEDELIAKFQKLHPDKDLPDPIPSHFRK